MLQRRTLVLGLLWVFWTRPALGAVPTAEREALLALYDSAGGSNWTNNGGWRSSPGTECDWAGVRCDEARGNVVELYLASNNLVGTVPDQLKNLTRLRLLNLSDNRLASAAPLGSVTSLEELYLSRAGLTGTIPASLGGLPNLVILDLSGNSLSGEIPTALAGLSKLKSLSLSDNQLSGPIPGDLSRLSALEGLILSGNQLTGGIPRQLGSIATLKNLSLQGNPQLGGSIPPELGSLRALEDLYVYYSGLTGSIPGTLGNLTAARRIHLEYNSLSGEIPASLGNLAKLTELGLASNGLTGSIPPELGRLSSVESFDLGGNLLTGTIPPELGSLKNATFLSVGTNKLTGSIPGSLGTLPALQRLYLDTNALTGKIPDVLAGLTSLQFLAVNDNKLTDLNTTTLAKMVKLEELHAHNNPLAPPLDLAPLAALKSLRYLGLGRCGLSGTIPAGVTALASLEELYLDNNAFGGTIPDLSALTKLTRLGLNDNQLTGPISGVLGRLTSLVAVGLEHNHLSGPIPGEVGRLTNLEYLNAHGNELTGPIPRELGLLAKLTELHLEENQLSGAIPGEIGALTQLAILVLNDNQLTGGFPSLGGLTNLRYLDLSRNQIGGAIPPDIGNLANLDTLYLTGNQLRALPPEIGKLSKLRYLFLDGNLLSGPLPKEVGDLPELIDLMLQGNQLSGSLPSELGKLAKLERLRINYNQLSGPIPAALSGLSSLREMSLESNQLTGPLPASLGKLKNLTYMNLSRNALNGAIPAELGDIGPSIVQLYLGGNILTGTVPSSLSKLTGLGGGYGLDLRYNALRTEDAQLREFINSKGCCFDTTQTLAPNDVKAPVTSTASVTIRWTPILYANDAGSYEVLVSQGSGAASVGATAATKQVTSATVGGLQPGTAYSFSVRTVTLPHDNNPNIVTSEPSAPITASTTASGSIAVSLSPATLRMIPGSQNMTATISPAAASAVELTLSSSNTTVATVPSSVIVPANATTSTFPVNGQRFGTTIVTATLPQSVGGSSAAADVVVADSACVRPNTPSFVTTNGGNVAVRAGNSINLSWTPTLANDPLGSYQLDTYTSGDCRTGLKQFRVEKATLSIATRTSQTGTVCFVVRALSGTNCPSGDSNSLVVTVQPGPAAFVVAQAAPLSAATSLGVAPADATIAFKNIGSTAATLTIRSDVTSGTVTPSTFPNVAPGGVATATLKYDVLTTSTKILRQASVCGVWNDGGEKTVCGAATLAVFNAPLAPGATASKVQFVSSNEVHFLAAPGTTPPAQQVTVRNPGTRPIRIAPAIGPGGAWLKLENFPLDPIAPGASFALSLGVDRTKRATAEGAPPVSTQLVVTNVDGPPGDSAILQVFDEEPQPAAQGTNRPPLTNDEYSLILGSSVYAPGSGGTIFVSDGWIRNKAPNEVTADLYYTPSETDGIGNTQVKRATVALRPYSTYRLSDFVRGLFDTSGSGSVEIRSRAIADLSVRTTVDTLTVKGDSLVRFGAEIPTIQSREGVGVGRLGGASLLLPGLRGGSGSDSRTNVILTETSGRPATVALRLFRADGTLLKEGNVTVLPYSKTQINSNNPALFPDGTSIDGASLEVKPVSGAGTVAAFATVIDNASSGYTTRTGRFVPQAFASATAAERSHLGLPTPLALPTRIAIASAAHVAGKNNSFFTTSVSITNGVASAANLTLKYVANGQTVATQGVTVPGRATVNYKDVIATLFGITDGTAGMVFVEGDVSKVVVSSDTSTLLDPSNTALGLSPSTLAGYAPQSVNALGDPQAGPPSPVISHPALEESARFRTNLILAEVQGAPATVRVRLFPPGAGGVPIAEAEYTLGAFEKIQRNQFMLEMAGPGLYIDYETTVEWVSGTGRILAVATKIDNDADSKRSDVYVLGPSGGLQGTIGF